MIKCTMQLDWLPNGQFAGIIYALERGWYRREGIDLDIRSWIPYLNQVESLKQERNMIVSTDANLVVKGKLKGDAVISIAAMLQHIADGWLVLKESGIKDFSQLKGRSIGVHTDGWTAINVMLNYAGLTMEDVNIIEIGFDYEKSLKDGKVDAMQCLEMVEPVEMEEKGYKADLFLARDYGYNPYAQVIATNDVLIREEKNMLLHFLHVTFEGWRAAFKNPDEAAKYVVEKYYPAGRKNQERKMIQDLYPLFLPCGNEKLMGLMQKERWKEIINLVGQDGEDVSGLIPEDLADFGLNRELYARV